MSRSYDEFVAMLEQHLVTDTADPDFVAILPRIIEAAELRCYRDLDLPSTKTTTAWSLTAGVASISQSGIVLVRDVYLGSAGVTYAQLLQRPDSFLRAYVPLTGLAYRGTPKYYSTDTDGTIRLAPAPAAAVTVNVVATIRPEPLSATNTTTTLTALYGDLLDYAALVYAAGWTKNFGAGADDPQAGLNWATLYATTLQAAKLEVANSKAFGPTDHTPTPPWPSNKTAGS